MLQLKIPPPIYALSIALIMWLSSQYFPVAQLVSSPWNDIGIVVMLLAVFLDFSSLYLFFKKRTTPNPMKPEFTTGLVTNSLYKISRNPMYLGMLTILFGFAIFLGNLTSFLVIPAFYIVITEMQIKPEERILEEKFGEEFLDYKNKVRRWL
ncbi:MAG: protein-S-isoprenylcysteine O-methyltransferase Ste14 [Cocleimonas sp.]